ncbi:SDR family oxidoreductase [Rhodobacteraceae bacterium SC52]|nr:SDR family oxidoreductase [Rhodobacteraceae bacterium SC52]
MKHNQFGSKGWTPERLGNLEGKSYVITGANAGAGFQAARILLGKGAEVVMLNRSAEKSVAAVKELKQEFGAAAPVRFVRMDLAEQASVRMAAEEVLKTTPRIDALICNAAIAQVPTRKLTPDGFESQLGTNHYGHFTLCGMLFDRVEETKGRIVVVASLGYNMGLKTIRFDDMNWDKGYGANTAYSQSKLAQMMFAYELQDRAKAANRNVDIYVCHPGSSATSLISTSGSRTMRFVWWLMTKTPMVQTAERGAYPEVMCATEEALTEQRALYGPTGAREFVGPVGRGTLNAHAYDKPVMVRLWERSEKDTGFSWSL